MKMNWERIECEREPSRGSIRSFGPMWRAKIPGGWFVVIGSPEGEAGVAFYPDPEHEWDGNSLP